MDIGSWEIWTHSFISQNPRKLWKIFRFFCSDLGATLEIMGNIQPNLDHFYEFNGATFVSIHALDQEIRNLPWICLVISGQKSTPSVLRVRRLIIYRWKGLLKTRMINLRTWKLVQPLWRNTRIKSGIKVSYGN